MLPRIRQALVVSAGDGRAVQALGHWPVKADKAEALLRFAQLAANSQAVRMVAHGQLHFLAMPLSGQDYVVVATGRLADDKERDTLIRLLKAGAVWYPVLKQQNALEAQGKVAQTMLADYQALASELVAQAEFKPALTLLVSRLNLLWQAEQTALLQLPKGKTAPQLLAVSGSSQVITGTAAAQSLIEEGQTILADESEAPPKVVWYESLCGLVVTTEARDTWLLLVDKPAQSCHGAKQLALFALLVPLIASQQLAHAGVLNRAAAQLTALRRYPWRWLAAAAVLGLLVLPMDYRISAQAELEGKTQRAVVAPEDGFIRESFARAGDTVAAGDLIARLDDDELQLESRKLSNALAELDRQYRKELVASNLSESRIVKSQMAQTQADLDLVNHKLGRTQLIAPFAGVIIAGDLQRAEGAPVEKGQVLFVIAPAGEFRLVLQVDERNMGALALAQPGRLYLSAAPNQPLEFTVTRISSVVADDDDGPQRYRVEASLAAAPQSLVLQPGMQGVAKIDAGRRSLGWILLHRPLNWLALKWWALSP